MFDDTRSPKTVIGTQGYSDKQSRVYKLFFSHCIIRELFIVHETIGLRDTKITLQFV